MAIDTHLSALAQTELTARRAALEAVLQQEGFAVTVQEGIADEKHPQTAKNYLLLPSSPAPCPLFCAHYDAHPGSVGANDNAASVCILIELAKALQEKNIPAAFAFLDGEETGHTGAKLLEKKREQEFSVVVNLDVCGYGDTLTVYAKGSEKKPAARSFCSKERLAQHNGLLVSFLPEGDDRIFSTRRQPVLSVAMMPKWDVQYLKALAGMGSGLLGRPPEFEMILGEMEVASTMHGGFRDKLIWVQPAAMQQVYDYLLDSVTAPPEKKTGFARLFG